MRVALKVDVDTYRGTLEGVPALLNLFDRYGIRATFLFSLGPDHTGRALRRIFRPGFLQKVRRTSVTSHYGYRTLLYGVLLPGPHIGRKAGQVLRDARDRGHEVGVHCYDHVRWQDFVAGKDVDWTRREMDRAMDAFREALGEEPATIGAAGWQLNRHVLAIEEALGFHYASDVRGTAPFYPVLDGVSSRCLQIPTTLPTLDELLGVDGTDIDNVHSAVERAWQQAVSGKQARDQVYTLHAELEGMQCLGVMERLIQYWRQQDADLVTLGDIYRHLDPEPIPSETVPLKTVPLKTIVWQEVPGRSGKLASEGQLISPAADPGLEHAG